MVNLMLDSISFKIDGCFSFYLTDILYDNKFKKERRDSGLQLFFLHCHKFNRRKYFRNNLSRRLKEIFRLTVQTYNCVNQKKIHMSCFLKINFRKFLFDIKEAYNYFIVSRFRVILRQLFNIIYSLDFKYFFTHDAR